MLGKKIKNNGICTSILSIYLLIAQMATIKYELEELFCNLSPRKKTGKKS